MKTNLRIWTEKENTRRKDEQQSTLKQELKKKKIKKSGKLSLALFPHYLQIRRVWNQNIKLWKGNDLGGGTEVNKW